MEGWAIGLGAALVGLLAACSGGSSGGSGAGGTVGQGGFGAAGTGANGGAPTGGSAGTGGVVTGSGQLLPLATDSDGMTLAIDASGALHVAVLTKTNGTNTAVYAKCTGQCDTDSSWSGVSLMPADGSAPPTIALTADGRPRVMFNVVLGASPGDFYAECDSGCDNGTNWKVVQLTQNTSPNPVPPARMPFAVSPNGSAAFAYSDNSGGFVMYCQSGCGTPSAWAKVQVGDAYLAPKMVSFGGDEAPQLVARHLVQQDERLAWLACAGDCTQPASWNGLEGLWVTHNNSAIDATMARTAGGAPRVAIYADDPNTPSAEKVYAYMFCDTQCTTPTNWVTVAAPLPADSNDHGFDMALDAAGRPVIGYTSYPFAGYARCTGDCATGPGWQTIVGIDTSVLDQNLPFTIPAECVQGFWAMQTGPSLAFSGDKVAMAFTASSRASGGSCGQDTYIGSQAFVALP